MDSYCNLHWIETTDSKNQRIWEGSAPRGGPFCEEGVGSCMPLTVCKRTGMLQDLLGSVMAR